MAEFISLALSDAEQAYQKGNYAKAAKLYRPLAQRGDAIAQTLLGVLYVNGAGVPKDYAEAVKWFRLAAEQGNATAQDQLGAKDAKAVLSVPILSN
jgi:uncharacterized protein